LAGCARAAVVPRPIASRNKQRKRICETSLQ
jgi:hypothetical protein